MEYFRDEKERLETLLKTFPDIFLKYPKTITQQQAAEICNVDVQTIRNWEKSGDLSFVPKFNRLIHYQQIKLEDLLTCWYIKQFLHEKDSIYISMLRKFYTQKYINYPGALYIRDVVYMTGYSKSAIVNWMNNDWLKGYNRGKTYRIPKKYLLDFVCGTYYQQIRRKSEIHKIDMESFMGKFEKRKKKL